VALAELYQATNLSAVYLLLLQSLDRYLDLDQEAQQCSCDDIHKATASIW